MDFVFPEQPKFPRKIYTTVVVTESAEFDVGPVNDGSKFSTEGTHTKRFLLHRDWLGTGMITKGEK